MERISDVNKVDIAIVPQSLNGALTSRYFAMREHRKAFFAVGLGAMAAGVTSVIQVMEARDNAGNGAAVLAGVAATVTANTRVASATLSVASNAGGVHVAGQTVTINGLVYTAAAADVPGTRTYAVGATGAASATNLFNKINAAATGVPGVTATYAVVGADEVITLVSSDAGETSITAVASAATTVVATLNSVAFVEVDAAELGNDMTAVAVRVTNSAACLTGVSLIRGNSRFNPDQVVAASRA